MGRNQAQPRPKLSMYKQNSKISSFTFSSSNGNHSKAHYPVLSHNLNTKMLQNIYTCPTPDPTRPVFCSREPVFRPAIIVPRRNHSSAARAGWFLGMGEKKPALPDIVKAGDPVLHEPAQEIRVDEIGADRVQRIIDDMVKVMREAPGVGLAAPQIGVPLRIIVLEDTKEYISYAAKEDIKAQDRRAFDLLVVINPKLVRKGNKTAFFFEGCLSVDGFRAVVERHLEVEVTGFDRDGQPIKVNASGWQARIFQHECDHLEGTLYVDKMTPRTFRTVDNLDLPLAIGCPKLGSRQNMHKNRTT